MRQSLFAILLAVAVSAPASANTIQNPGFETGDLTSWDTPTGGWTVSTGIGAITGPNSGTYFATTHFQGFLQQAVPTVAGTTYDLSFVYNPDNSGGELDVWVAGHPFFVPATPGWTTFHFQVVGDGFPALIRFAPVTAIDFGLDDIRFEASTPIPAALPLFASGAAVLGFLGWRRKRKYAALEA